MIVTSILGNTADFSSDELADLHVERVVVPLEALAKRVQRVTTDHGREFGIRLDPGQQLSDGDILVREGASIVIIARESSDVLAIAPETMLQMAVVAHSLGNRHLQAQFFGADLALDGIPVHDAVMVIPYDHTAEHFLQHQQVRFMRTELELPVPFRHAEHTH